MDTAKQHWEILRRVPNELANKVREFMVIGDKGDGVLLVTENGDGYWLGEMRFEKESREAVEPTRLDVPNLDSMAQSDKHILLLNKSGQIYGMGKNYYGQLGLGSVDHKTRFSPQQISSPHKFISVRCGLWHSLALTEDGGVWSWGSNYFGQIGVSTFTANPQPSPHQISKLNSRRVVAIECGSHHSLALTDQGEIYAWGWNEWRQQADRSTHNPTRIPTPSPIQSIAAGDKHTLLLTQTGEVYVRGGNESGQLGLPTTLESSASLVKVDGLPAISHIASHFFTNLSIAMTAKQECFVWGDLNNVSIHTPLQLPSIYSTINSVLSFRLTKRNTPYSVRVEGLVCLQGTNFKRQSESLIGPNILVNRIAGMFDNPNSNPDVKFQLGDQTILAHRRLLQIFSAHFDQLFSKSFSTADLSPPTKIFKSSRSTSRHTSNPSKPNSQTPLTTIPILDHSYPTFHAYLHFIYTGTLQVPTEHLADLFQLARSHLESDLEQLCLERMRSFFSPENCCLFYQLTEPHPLPEFQQDLLQFISNNILQVFPTTAYQSMDGDLCKKLTISIANLRR